MLLGHPTIKITDQSSDLIRLIFERLRDDDNTIIRITFIDAFLLTESDFLTRHLLPWREVLYFITAVRDPYLETDSFLEAIFF